MRNCINVSQTNNLVIIKISNDANYKDIQNSIKKKVSQLKKIYKGEKTPIMVTGKVLKNDEIDEIEEIIKSEINVDIKFDMPRKMGLSNIRKTFTQEISNSETKFHHGSIRSGQKIEEEGSIVIIGDVNPGAEVIAGDNIVVVGKLRGLAHAGAKGNMKAIIAAGELDTVQLRIANIVKEIGREDKFIYKQAYIYINEEENKIIID